MALTKKQKKLPIGLQKAILKKQKQTIQKSNQAVSKETPKAVEKIKSMTKARNQSMSLDEPIVRRKKKRG
jgi:hypothetical protein